MIVLFFFYFGVILKVSSRKIIANPINVIDLGYRIFSLKCSFEYGEGDSSQKFYFCVCFSLFNTFVCE